VSESVSQSVGQFRVAVAEVWGQFGNPEEGECPPLETITRRLVKTQQTEKTEVCALVKWLQLLVVTDL
jgi:hypothetical protein